MVSLVILTTLWFMFHEVAAYVMAIGDNIAVDLGSNSTTRTQVSTFFDNLDTWFPVLALLGVGLWAWVYAQKKQNLEGVYGV